MRLLKRIQHMLMQICPHSYTPFMSASEWRREGRGTQSRGEVKNGWRLRKPPEFAAMPKDIAWESQAPRRGLHDSWNGVTLPHCGKSLSVSFQESHPPLMSASEWRAEGRDEVAGRGLSGMGFTRQAQPIQQNPHISPPALLPSLSKRSARQGEGRANGAGRGFKAGFPAN